MRLIRNSDADAEGREKTAEGLSACKLTTNADAVLRSTSDCSLQLIQPGGCIIRLSVVTAYGRSLKKPVMHLSALLDAPTSEPSAALVLAQSKRVLVAPHIPGISGTVRSECSLCMLGEHSPGVSVSAIASLPNMFRLVSADTAGSIRLWDAASGSLLAIADNAHPSSVRSLALTSTKLSQTVIASGGDDGAVRVWGIPSQSSDGADDSRLLPSVASSDHSPITALAFGNDVQSSNKTQTSSMMNMPFSNKDTAGAMDDRADLFCGHEKIAAGTADGFVHVWKANKPGQAAPQLQREALRADDEGFYIQSLAFHPECTALAVSCSLGPKSYTSMHKSNNCYVRVFTYANNLNWYRLGLQTFHAPLLHLSYLQQDLPVHHLLAIPSSGDPKLLQTGNGPFASHMLHASADKLQTHLGSQLKMEAEGHDGNGNNYGAAESNTHGNGRWKNPPIPSLNQLRHLQRPVESHEELEGIISKQVLSSDETKVQSQKNEMADEDQNAVGKSMGEQLEEALHGSSKTHGENLLTSNTSAAMNDLREADDDSLDEHDEDEVARYVMIRHADVHLAWIHL